MYGNYYVDAQISKCRQEEIMREVKHDSLVEKAKQSQPKTHLFSFLHKAAHKNHTKNVA